MINKDLDKALNDIDTDDAEEFAKFFDDVIDAEEEQLLTSLGRIKALKTASSVMTAGPLDFVKNIFKKKPAPEETDDSEGSDGVSPSYTMDDSTMDEFVDGKTDWEDASHYIKHEFNENTEFFSGVDGLLKSLKEVRKKPSRSLVESIKKTCEKMIRFGESIVKGARQHLMEPGTKNPDRKPSSKLDGTVEHYADMLKESLGDEKKTLKFLKELFKEVGPLIEDERATLASKKILPVLIRTARSVPRTREVLVPVIRRIVAAKLVCR